MLSLQATTSPDAVFELASVVIAVAGWRMRRAAYLCPDTRSGISSEQASKVRLCDGCDSIKKMQ